MQANGYGKRGAGIAGKEKMPWFTNVDDLMKALNSKYEPVMHIVEGENLKIEDFRNQKFRVDGVTLKVDDIRAEYPIFVENGKARTDFFLKLYGDCDDEHHEVLIHFPHEKQQQALDFYAAVDCFRCIEVHELWDSDEDDDHDDYWGFVKTFKADKCVNPFSFLNAVCHCSDGIQDLLKCRVTSEAGLIECSIRDFVICTDFLVDKALAIMQEYCREQCSPDGFDIFSTPIGEGRYKKDYWRSYVFCDEANDTLRGAFQVTLRGGQCGWLIGNNEQELQAIAERYPVLAGPCSLQDQQCTFQGYDQCSF